MPELAKQATSKRIPRMFIVFWIAMIIVWMSLAVAGGELKRLGAGGIAIALGSIALQLMVVEQHVVRRRMLGAAMWVLLVLAFAILLAPIMFVPA